MRRLGSGLGCGAISILTDDCPVAVAASVMAYFDRENAGQCGSCFNGTAAMSAVASALRDGWRPTTTSRAFNGGRWCCAVAAPAALDGATNIAASLLHQFPQAIARHLANDCQTCRAGAFEAVRPYEVEAVAQS
ncbi:hypothetical protein MCEL_00100 [Mycolicibacterium celeriflavum]|uniref:NADH-ubiquinone oxidoreductase 51kDa subunit iron-sulphur binding domain-containing protein n=1 Tax=Mycolicibacterium celeriflavum TaxID=1249101 RepID=A0A7I7RCW1_MYCCF|nr:NADH-ubiquinone oxidoreductase-F iron-sulfur binding region domain-containing protein [Mycolicibacterium celeriflavum]BBY41715.1 hypothetical protein MCEL_00100 [Mycolicibacterium celeriflavum]